jgi:hypothetical protein
MSKRVTASSSRELAFLRQNQTRGRSLVDRTLERRFVLRPLLGIC